MQDREIEDKWGVTEVVVLVILAVVGFCIINFWLGGVYHAPSSS